MWHQLNVVVDVFFPAFIFILLSSDGKYIRKKYKVSSYKAILAISFSHQLSLSSVLIPTNSLGKYMDDKCIVAM